MSDKLLTPIEIGLTAAIVAIAGQEPLILTARGSDGLAGLPFGPFD
ncbi:NAD regulator, partial [Bradyrhizobium sp. PRIMUS42]|nr:NAD regulator [Bradyrhizobium sp. PRIMUS42]